MQLWTSMEESLYHQTLGQNKPYRCDTNKCEMLSFDSDSGQYHKAYNWMSEQMTQKIGPAPKGITYPIWAWYKVRNLHKRPDLRWIEFKGMTKPMVLIELEIEDNKVLLSDENIWTAGQLNDAPCFMNQPDDVLDAEIDWYYDNKSVPWTEKEIFKMSTWERIFDIRNSEHVQATFWELKPKNINKIWHYNQNIK